MGRTLSGAFLGLLLLASLGCGGETAARSLPAHAAAATDAAGQPIPRRAVSPLVPPEGRVFFGKAEKEVEAIATEEVLVVPLESGRARVHHRELELVGALDATGRFTSTVSSDPFELVLHADGTFEGARTHSEGNATKYVATPYRPLEPELLSRRRGL